MGFDKGSCAVTELLDALCVVHTDGTWYRAWCLKPDSVNMRVGDLNVMVYGFSFISAVRSPDFRTVV